MYLAVTLPAAASRGCCWCSCRHVCCLSSVYLKYSLCKEKYPCPVDLPFYCFGFNQPSKDVVNISTAAESKNSTGCQQHSDTFEVSILCPNQLSFQCSRHRSLQTGLHVRHLQLRGRPGRAPEEPPGKRLAIFHKKSICCSG